MLTARLGVFSRPAWLAAAAKVTGSGTWPLSRATGSAKTLFVTTACSETL
jgi:hypothetical protein